jgi:hypothetical protein
MKSARRLGTGQDHRFGGLFFGYFAHSSEASVARPGLGIKRIGMAVTLELTESSA